jgi:hypothetical protein
MADWPRNEPLPLMIDTFSLHFSPISDWRNIQGGAVTPAAATATANLAMYTPINLPFDYPVNRVYWGNGSSLSANMAMGIFDMNGRRIYTTGSTAMSGASTLQFVTPGTTFVLPAGGYYLALSCDGTTNRLSAVAPAVNRLQELGCLQQTSNFALADPATFATPTVALYPIIGITRTQANFPV